MRNNFSKYLQLIVLIVAAGTIYPMLYLRQNYQTSMLDVFHISATQFGELYSVLGIFFFVGCLPSGWLADRFSPRKLISFSLVGTGVLGFWYATFPGFTQLLIIFCGWGVTAGLTFWGALIKRVNLLSKKDEQGRFYGALDGGRGFVEALLATIAVSVFAYIARHHAGNVAMGLKQVIHIYACSCVVVGIIILFFEDPAADQEAEKELKAHHTTFLQDLKTILANKQLLLMSLIIFCGYQQFWATYLFSGYMQNGGLSAVTAGFIIAFKLWMRPIGGIGGGILGDKFSNINILIITLFISAICLCVLSLISVFQSVYMVIFFVIFCGLITYIIRGIYWAILEVCHLPNDIKGLAIGLISIIGYSPDIFLPILNGYLSDTYPGLLGYRIFFLYIAVMGIIGGLAAIILKASVTKKVTARRVILALGEVT